MRTKDQVSGPRAVSSARPTAAPPGSLSAGGLPGYYLTFYHDLAVEPAGGAIYVAMRDEGTGGAFPSRC